MVGGWCVRTCNTQQYKMVGAHGVCSHLVPFAQFAAKVAAHHVDEHGHVLRRDQVPVACDAVTAICHSKARQSVAFWRRLRAVLARSSRQVVLVPSPLARSAFAIALARSCCFLHEVGGHWYQTSIRCQAKHMAACARAKRPPVRWVPQCTKFTN